MKIRKLKTLKFVSITVVCIGTFTKNDTILIGTFLSTKTGLSIFFTVLVLNFLA